MKLKFKFKPVTAAVLGAAFLGQCAYASNVGVPVITKGPVGAPIDLCELAPRLCTPKPLLECKPGSMIWPQCIMTKEPVKEKHSTCHSKNWDRCWTNDKYDVDLSKWSIDIPDVGTTVAPEFGGEIPWLLESVCKGFDANINIDEFINFGGSDLVTQVTSASASIGEDSVFVNAQGMVNTGGWTNILLQQKVYFVPPADGLQEIIFLGTKPSGMKTMAFVNVNANLVMSKPDWLKGIRIIAGSNSIDVGLENKATNTAEVQSNGEYWPLPLGKTVIQ